MHDKIKVSPMNAVTLVSIACFQEKLTQNKLIIKHKYQQHLSLYSPQKMQNRFTIVEQASREQSLHCPRWSRLRPRRLQNDGFSRRRCTKVPITRSPGIPEIHQNTLINHMSRLNHRHKVGRKQKKKTSDQITNGKKTQRVKLVNAKDIVDDA